MPIPVPYALPTAPSGQLDRPGFTHQWIGTDGSEWVLSGDSRPLSNLSGVRLKSGLRGLHMPQVTRYTSDTPGAPGQLYRGSHVEAREVAWPISVWQDGTSAEWVAYDRAWWASMDPDGLGEWVVTAPDTTVRRLPLQPLHDGSHTYERDPSQAGWAPYLCSLVADDPLWLGTPITRTFTAGAPAGFFSAPGDPFVIRISSGSLLSTATIPNPGDVGSYVVATAHGPASAITVGLTVDGVRRVTTFTPDAPLVAGEGVVIDSRPQSRSVVDLTGVDRIAELTELAFDAIIPPGTNVPLDLEVAGAGPETSVSIDLVPRYYRAW